MRIRRFGIDRGRSPEGLDRTFVITPSPSRNSQTDQASGPQAVNLNGAIEFRDRRFPVALGEKLPPGLIAGGRLLQRFRRNLRVNTAYNQQQDGNKRNWGAAGAAPQISDEVSDGPGVTQIRTPASYPTGPTGADCTAKTPVRRKPPRSSSDLDRRRRRDSSRCRPAIRGAIGLFQRTA